MDNKKKILFLLLEASVYLLIFYLLPCVYTYTLVPSSPLPPPATHMPKVILFLARHLHY